MTEWEKNKLIDEIPCLAFVLLLLWIGVYAGVWWPLGLISGVVFLIAMAAIMRG